MTAALSVFSAPTAPATASIVSLLCRSRLISHVIGQRPSAPAATLSAHELQAARDASTVVMSTASARTMSQAARFANAIIAYAKDETLKAAMRAGLVPITTDRGLLTRAGYKPFRMDDVRYIGFGKLPLPMAQAIQTNVLPQLCFLDPIVAAACVQTPADIPTFITTRVNAGATTAQTEDLVALIAAEWNIKPDAARHFFVKLRQSIAPAPATKKRGRPPKVAVSP